MLRFSDRKQDSLTWNAVGALVLVVSLCVNFVSIPVNVLQIGQLIKETSEARIDLGGPVSDIDIYLVSGAGAGRWLDEAGNQGAGWFGVPRQLSSSTSASSASCGGGHHGPHPHEALIFLFSAFLIGAAVMQISAIWPILQQTVLLFILGFIASLIIKGADVEKDMGKFGVSYSMWMDVDPHLLLFTLLPALLAGDAMTIDTSVAKRVAMQCLWLAGPGVIIGGFSTAFFLKLLLGWEFKFCLAGAAMLCATDPVAVVALLKELGASPIITVQIQGESLLNDGTAIVLYLVSYNMIMGENYDAADIADFLIKKAMMAWALGLFIGYFFFSWIRASADKLDHASGMIQITLTLCCAYWSFIFVEGVLQLSGVLATVASSLVLANHMWPYVVSEESMHHVWHTFEALGNMIVFFLAGAKTGNIFLDIDGIDILNLLLIYLFLVLIRGTLIFSSRPVLKQLSPDKQPVTWQDATLMTWGGLRGAVGLCLALAVERDGAPDIVTGLPNLEKKETGRLLFFVSGIALLTTMVNATTAPSLVNKLGITALPQARQTLLKMFHSQLVNWSKSSDNPPEVTDCLMEMLHEAEHHIDHTKISSSGPQSMRSKSDVEPLTGDASRNLSKSSISHRSMSSVQQNADLIRELRKEEVAYKARADLQKGLFGKPLGDNLLGKVDDIVELISDQWVDEGMAKVVNQIFLEMVFANYWKLIGSGELRPGSVESDVLMASVRMSLSPYRANLDDYEYVHGKMIADDDFKDEIADGSGSQLGALADAELAANVAQGPLSSFVASWQFNVGVAVAILFNSLQVAAEEIWRKPGTAIHGHSIWLFLDGFFTLFFFIEMLAKMGVMKLSYFGNNWNRFDFFLVWVGIFGLVMSIATHGEDSAEVAGKTRIIRVARVLRTLRFLRIFRLFHARMSADKYVSMELARHMKKVVTLDCFIRAHVMAQQGLVYYFGGNGLIDTVNETEIGRCILQSQVSTYRALQDAANTQAMLGEEIYTELRNLHRRKQVTENLSNFVLHAHHDGAISATEAHAILHPLNHQIAECLATLADRAEGVLERKGSHDSHGVHEAHGVKQNAHVVSVDPDLPEPKMETLAVEQTAVAVKSPASESEGEPVSKPSDASPEAQKGQPPPASIGLPGEASSPAPVAAGAGPS
jgi:NhaP-type Na+/H+ or K+/H+ antiporter